mmetsp:Transcript_37424/g.93901  ORF Transcript_37424/g.93901 Transcript_37424/m.93901 type:complete len:281 (+) Transcript_37424:266-1108(+)
MSDVRVWGWGLRMDEDWSVICRTEWGNVFIYTRRHPFTHSSAYVSSAALFLPGEVSLLSTHHTLPLLLSRHSRLRRCWVLLKHTFPAPASPIGRAVGWVVVCKFFEVDVVHSLEELVHPLPVDDRHAPQDGRTSTLTRQLAVNEPLWGRVHILQRAVPLGPCQRRFAHTHPGIHRLRPPRRVHEQSRTQRPTHPLACRHSTHLNQPAVGIIGRFAWNVDLVELLSKLPPDVHGHAQGAVADEVGLAPVGAAVGAVVEPLGEYRQQGEVVACGVMELFVCP